jgi:hypothetical protein
VCSLWFITYEAYQGEAFHCPDFAALAQQVEFQAGTHDDPLGLRENRENDENRKSIDWFWITFQRHFPRVKHLVFRVEGQRHPPLERLPFFDRAVNRRPRGMNIHVAVSSYTAGVKGSLLAVEPFTLWNPRQLQGSAAIRWEVVHKNWLPNRILMPGKVAHGIAGQFSRILYFSHRLYQLERFAKVKLVHDAIEDFYFGSSTSPGQFACPMDECNTVFKNMREWNEHYIHQRHGRPWSEAYRKLLPGANHQALIDLLKENKELKGTFIDSKTFAESLKYGTADWELKKVAFIQQLTEDPLHKTPKPPEYSNLYAQFEMYASDDQHLPF